MSIEKIKNTILEDARKEAEKLVEAARNGLALRLDREKLLMKKELEERLESLRRELEKERHKTLSTLKARYDRQILELKNEVIDRVFREAMDGVLSFTRQEYLALLEGWLDRLGVDEKAELRLASKDLRGIGPELIRRANESRRENPFFLAASAVDIKGGFILKADEFEIDRSLESILGHLREELIPQVADDLFGKK